MQVTFSEATDADASAIAALRTAAAVHLSERFGKGHWSASITEKGVRRALQHSKIVFGRSGADIIAVARLATKKPWAIDVSYFTACRGLCTSPTWRSLRSCRGSESGAGASMRPCGSSRSPGYPGSTRSSTHRLS